VKGLSVKALCVVFLVLVGCGVEPYVSECHYEGMGPIRGDFELDCDQVARDIDTAREYLDALGMVKGDKQFETIFKHVDVRVRAKGDLNPDPKVIVTGMCYWHPVGATIELDSRGESILHEMFHAVDFHNLYFGDHPHWGYRGLWSADGNFSYRMRPKWNGDPE
jgi:hypothetical protein